MRAKKSDGGRRDVKTATLESPRRVFFFMFLSFMPSLSLHPLHLLEAASRRNALFLTDPRPLYSAFESYTKRWDWRRKSKKKKEKEWKSEENERRGKK